eukprot:2264371-Amphidinium_carterae.1
MSANECTQFSSDGTGCQLLTLRQFPSRMSEQVGCATSVFVSFESCRSNFLQIRTPLVQLILDQPPKEHTGPRWDRESVGAIEY